MTCKNCIHNDVCKEELKEQIYTATKMLDHKDECNPIHCQYYLSEEKQEITPEKQEEKNNNYPNIKVGDILYEVNRRGDIYTWEVIFIKTGENKYLDYIRIKPIVSIFNVDSCTDFLDYSQAFINEAFTDEVSVHFSVLINSLNKDLFLDYEKALSKSIEVKMYFDDYDRKQNNLLALIYSIEKIYSINTLERKEHQVVEWTLAEAKFTKEVSNVELTFSTKDNEPNDISPNNVLVIKMGKIFALDGILFFTDRFDAEEKIKKYFSKY